jgi:hypothetical protein
MIFNWNTAGGTPDFVKTLYQNILDRDPENQAVIDGWTNYLRFHGVAATIGGFFNSDEFKAKNLPQEIIVDKLYYSILRCEGDVEGKNFWLGRLRYGEAIQIIINKFVANPGYSQKVLIGLVPPPACVSLSCFILEYDIYPPSEPYFCGTPLVECRILSRLCIRIS